MTKYDPAIHDALLKADGQDVIVVDAEIAKLTELPEDVQRALVRSTVQSMLMLLIADGLQPLIVPAGDWVEIKLQGMKKGLALFGKDANDEINAAIDALRQVKGLPPLPENERKNWV